MTKPHYISSLCFLLIALAVLTSCGAERNMKKGEKYLALGEYFDAANEFKQAYQKIPPKQRDKRGVAAGKMALCYDKSLQTAKGIAAYRNVIRYNQAKTQDHLSLAQLLMKNGSYKEAAAEFQLVLDSMPDNVLARKGLESSKDAPTIKEQGS